MTAKNKRNLMLAGLAGLLGALFVGIGESMMQYTDAGKMDDETYDYFLDVDSKRLSMGHFLCVLTAPLYFLGYLHLGKAIDRSYGWLGKTVTGLGIYSFGVAIAWIGGRVYLGLGRKALEIGESSPELLRSLSEHNEPFIEVLRITILLISVLWVYGILKGKSYYPKWMVILAPIFLLITIVVTYLLVPSIGKYLLPAAMNVTHVIVFGVSLIYCSRITVTPDTSSK